jgi:asparagine synthase (glutamine-hydrolysing)
MCGLCGIFELTPQTPALKLLERMNQALQHRGPNDEGIYLDGPIGLGHRRLAILDLSVAGHQPMSSTDQNYWIVYNGEVYNYLELRTDLQQLGYKFRSESDTEVILAAYQAYGIDCLNKFNGMWSFAIWDQQRQELFCSRDRFGIKPFYYYSNSERFIFASEIKALLQHPQVPRSIDDSVCYRFLAFGQSNVGEESFFADIRQLEAGHCLIVNRDGIQKKCYWDLQETSAPFSLTPKLAIQEFKRLFVDSVHLRMRSDVPIGTCLSGGLDSSSIVCVANQLSQKSPEYLYQQETFSSCFDSKIFDERPFIDSVIEHTGAKRNYLFPEPQTFLHEVESLVSTQNEPFSSLSIFAQWSVMKKVKERGITVLLDGQGADELLAGYGHDGLFWNELLQDNQWIDLKSEIRASFSKYGVKTTLRRFGRMLASQQINSWNKIKIKNNSFISKDFQNSFFQKFYQEKKATIFQKQLKNELYHELKYGLMPLLRYEDRNSMAFSLESRLPFLDYRLVEFSFSLPDTLIIQNGWSKWILRQAMAGILPEKIRWRQDKMGFVTPQDIWFKEELAPFIHEVLHDPNFQQRSYWNSKKIIESYQMYLKNNDPTIKIWLWRFISTELWLKWIKTA